MRHLLSIEDLDRADIERILDRARSFTEVSEREVKKVPALRGRRVLNLFYEASTRTRSSFELAAKSLSAPTSSTSPPAARASRRASRSRTPSRRSRAYQPDLIVDPHAARRRRRSWSRAGRPPRSSTPATASTSTRPRRCWTSTRCASGSARSTGPNIWIVGDVLHSRVARSNILAFTKLGARVTVCGPPTLIPRGIEALGCEVAYTLDRARRGRRRLRAADAARAHDRVLRPEPARVRGAVYQIDGRRLGPRQLLMHPGPVNRGVELAAEVVDSPQALIGQQVAAGVVVRMAVLYECLAGRDARRHPEPSAAPPRQPA